MKMETPKMDVVRFKEADVLAASPIPGPVYHDYVKIANLGNGDFSDNYANAMNTDYSFTDIHNGEVSHLLHLDSTFNNGSDEKTLSELVNDTFKDDTSYGSFNGLYEYDNNKGKYFRQ